MIFVKRTSRITQNKHANCSCITGSLNLFLQIGLASYAYAHSAQHLKFSFRDRTNYKFRLIFSVLLKSCARKNISHKLFLYHTMKIKSFIMCKSNKSLCGTWYLRIIIIINITTVCWQPGVASS